MKTPIFQLVYTSKSVDQITLDILNSILESSRKRNLRDDITGFLAVRDGYFLQILEGEEKKVRDCYNRIITDQRHQLITLQGEAQVAQRIARTWSMGMTTDRGATKDLVELFELGRHGKNYKDSATLLNLVKMFAKNAFIVG